MKCLNFKQTVTCDTAFTNDIGMQATYLHCCKHCHGANGGVGQRFGRVFKSQFDEANCL